MKNRYILGFAAMLVAWNLTSQGVHFEKDVSLRNNQESHYYKMVGWDDAAYEEFAYWKESQYGAVMEFMNWRVMFPEGYDASDTTKKYPTVVMVHGAGESGRKWTDRFEYTPEDPEYDNNGHQLLHGGLEHRNAVNRDPSHPQSFPGIVIFPQVSYNGVWVAPDNIRMLGLVLEYMISEYHVDRYRISLHGLSNGARGTWEIATARPDLIAGILPMSGVGYDSDASTDTLLTTPVWCFQGGQDTNPSPGWTESWMDELSNKGGRPRYTYYPENGHNTWWDAYREPDFFSWMLAMDKREIYVFGDSSDLTVSEIKPRKLGFSAGYLAYQWTRDSVDLAGETSRYLDITEPGTYTVKFQHRIDSTWSESYPLEMKEFVLDESLVYIPDHNLKSALVGNSSINLNQDDEIQVTEAESYKGMINVYGLGISDMKGIEAFDSLTDLRVHYNNLTSIDISANTQLTQLHCQGNQLDSLDISANTKLTKLRCFDNNLTLLNIKNGNNANMGLFQAKNNNLTCVDVDDVAYAEINWTDDVDEGVVFALDCSEGTPADVVDIPDANFKSALVADTLINTNGDDEIQYDEAEAYTGTIDVNSLGIEDMTGLEAFTEITQLRVYGNSLTTLDLSANLQLVELHCHDNQLVSLDISANAGIKALSCFGNNLTMLNVQNGNNTNFDLFLAYDNDLTCIQVDDVAYAEANWADDVDEGVEFMLECESAGGEYVVIPDANFKTSLLANTAINTNGNDEIEFAEAEAFTGAINVNSSSIADLTGIEAFTALTDLRIHYNNITSVDLSANLELVQLHCQKNQLTSLDISANTKLKKLRCFDNDLSELNVKNGNNSNFDLFQATGNDLTCVQVDDVAHAEANWTDDVDAGVSFSEDCSGAAGQDSVHIPDTNLKNALVSDTLINTNGDSEIQYAEAEAVEGTLDLDGLGITDITGIEAFTSITTLQVNNNSLVSIDLSANLQLEALYVQMNQLETLDVSANSHLKTLSCYDNSLAELNIQNGNNTNFELLQATGNNLACVQVDDVTFAEANWTDDVDEGVEFSLNCSVDGEIVWIPDANLKAKLVANSAINTNGDDEIQRTEAEAYTGIVNVNSSGITDMTGIEAFTALTDLRVHNNSIASLDLSANLELVQLHCQKNQLDSLNISLNTKLKKLRCFDNQLTMLNVQNGNNSNFDLFQATGNNLSCVQVDNVSHAESNWTGEVDPGVSFSTDCDGGESSSRVAASTEVSTKKSKVVQKVTVFPNPFVNRVTITADLSTEEQDNLMIYGMGSDAAIKPKKVRYKDGQLGLDLSGLPEGQYILQLGGHSYRLLKK